MVLNRIALGKKAAPFTVWTTIDIPGASTVVATGIDKRGQVVGSYIDGSGHHGFLLQNGAVTSINIPGMAETIIQDINSRGVMIGTFVDVHTDEVVGFVLEGDTWTTLPSPLQPLGINDKGVIVGIYYDEEGRVHGFLLETGEVTVIDFPGAENTWVTDINRRGQIVGYQGTFIVGVHSGFILEDGVFTTINHPDGFSTELHGINNRGQIVGVFDFDKGWRSFLLSRGEFSDTFIFPNIPAEGEGTHADDVNDRGQIVGWYGDWFSNIHGFKLE